MKVVQILPELNEGGVERGVVELTREFQKYDIKSFVVSSGGKLVNELNKNGVEYVYCDVCSKNIFTFIPRILKLRKILKHISPDIVHVRSRIPAWLLLFAKFGLKFKIVSTVHGLNSVNFYSKIMTKADKIICVSNYVKEYIIKNFSADVLRIKVIFRGVDIENFNPQNLPCKSELRQKFSYCDNGFIVSCVGRISATKNIETLIKAVKILQEDYKNIKLLVVGGVHKNRKNYFEKLLKICNELEVKDFVIFTGSLNNIQEIYKLSDVVVSPSIKPESFGRSVAEAIAINTPVVASNHGGVKDIIQSGVNGYFFSPLDEKELAKKIAMANKLEFDGFSYIKNKFNLENMVKDTMMVYKEVL